MSFFERIAVRLGAEETYRSHGHHIARIGRVLIVGVVGLIIQSAIFEVLGIRIAVVSPSTATLIGAEVAILVNFFLNERFNFAHVHHSSRLYVRLLRFHLLVSISLAIQWSSLFLAQNRTNDAMVLRLVFVSAVGIGFVFNYLGYYFFVWKEQRDGEG